MSRTEPSGLRAVTVRYERRYCETRDRQRVRDDLGSIGELRQQVRRHEAADFDLAQATGRQRRDPRLLRGRRHDRLDALQAVARPHFADENVAAH